MASDMLGHTFTAYDEMVQESIDWYARGLKMWMKVKRDRKRKRKKSARLAELETKQCSG